MTRHPPTPNHPQKVKNKFMIYLENPWKDFVGSSWRLANAMETCRNSLKDLRSICVGALTYSYQIIRKSSGVIGNP